MMGQKAVNLERMKRAGINVPDFSVLSFDKINSGDTLDLSELAVLNDKSIDKFAVRSSASVEDGNSVSFAGQFETFLNVERADVGEKIRCCLRSMQSETVKKYAGENNISLGALQMDVIVQKMVNPELSGVMFTSNPQGLLNETVITVGKGLGDGVVSEKTESASYYYSTTDKLYYYDGTENMLSDRLVEELIAVSEKIKSVIGEFLDIEFAIENGIIYILQARSITTLNGESPLILDNSNIVESYPGVSLPITISFVHMVYSGVFRGVCRRIVKNEKVVDQKKDVYNNMVGDANGRLYYKISNWYTALRFLPFSKRIIPIWQEMLGVKAKSYTGEEVTIPPFVRMMSYVNFLLELVRVPKNMDALDREFHEVNESFYKSFNENMTAQQLFSIYEEIRRRLFAVWDVTLINDMYAFIFTGLLKSRLKKLGRTDDQINEYISGISDIESMKPMKKLIDIAYHKSEYSIDEYESEKREYISKYGDRALEELKLESRTFRSSPELFDKRVEFYRADPERLEDLFLQFQTHGTAHDYREDMITAFLRKKAALGIKNREVSRLNRSRAYGIVRQIFLTIGKSGAEKGLIDNPRDIFYLTVEEAFDIPENAKDLIDERKAQYKLFERLPAYSRLIFENSEFNKNHGSVKLYRRSSSKNILNGTPCSFGKAEGQACVITDVRSADDIRGKILVTKMTDPGWVFLLAAAKGVISEKGSLLSHTAIISRELKVPSIVGVDGLLEAVHSGDTIRMDGSTGCIEIIRSEDSE